MALTYSKVDIRGKAVEPVFAELLFLNESIAKGHVNFQDGIKADTIVTEAGMTVAMQAYTSDEPTASGGIGLYDKSITPTKVMFFDKFDPETLRSSRFNRDMAKGAWNLGSSEFENLIMTEYSGKIANDVEAKFWNNATAATKTAVAALTAGTGQTAVGAAEQTLVAATAAGLFDGVVTTMIYNSPYQGQAAGVGGRVKVAGTTVSSTNIATEYGKIYAAIPSKVLNGNSGEKPLIYAPYSHKQMINIYNVSATYRDLFSVVNLGQPTEKYFYNGVEIVFKPLAENVVICANPSHIMWLTDLQADINTLAIDKIANNREDRFLKAIMTQYAWVIRQSMNVLYVG